jgi:hypothetical protein
MGVDWSDIFLLKQILNLHLKARFQIYRTRLSYRISLMAGCIPLILLQQYNEDVAGKTVKVLR